MNITKKAKQLHGIKRAKRHLELYTLEEVKPRYCTKRSKQRNYQIAHSYISKISLAESNNYNSLNIYMLPLALFWLAIFLQVTTNSKKTPKTKESDNVDAIDKHPIIL